MNLCGKIISKFGLKYFCQFLMIVFYVLCFSTETQAQQEVAPNSRIENVTENDSSQLSKSSSKDSVKSESLEEKLGIKISKDAISSVVNAKATDSAVMLIKDNIFSLYGNAEVVQDDIKLNAGQIVYEQNNNSVKAKPIWDTSGVVISKPTFAQGSEVVTYDSLQYNFKSKRAIIRNARSQYGEGFVISQQIKRNADQSIYGWKNIYTTCSLDTPHFGIKAQKIKVIPNKLIASASANIVIEQVPTPFFLPFVLFPITQKQRSGFQMPSYTIEEQRGLGLTNGGYYFHFNDYVDLLLVGNIYTKGSYNVSGVSAYANRYHYSGGVSMSFANNKTGESYEPGAYVQKDFSIQWRHQNDPKARPGSNFNANVNIASSSFYSNNSYNVNSIVQNQLYSSVSYSKSWANKPYSLVVGANHNQNLTTKEVRMTIPELNFYVTQFNPFEKKNRVGSPKWYEKISASYSVNVLNQTVFRDTGSAFSNLSSNDFKNGIKHVIPITANYNVFRFINLSIGANYNEYWMTEKLIRGYNDVTGKIDSIQSRGFYTARDFSSSINLSTRIYGVKMFKKGWVKGVRHMISPNVGMGYVPDFAASPWNYYNQVKLDTSNNYFYESPYVTSIVGVPGLGQYGKFSSTVNFGLNNNLQMKVRSKSDTTGGGKNITLIDGLSFGTSYNLAADSFNWRPFDVSFRTNLLNTVSLAGGANFDPYDQDVNTGRRISRTILDNGKGLARFTNGNLSLSANFRSKENKNKKSIPNNYIDEYNLLMRDGRYYNYVDFNIPWNLNFTYSMRVNKSVTNVTKKDTLVFDQSLMFNGDFNLTPRWKIAFNSGYNFDTKELAITSIDIYRDLHCWEMRLSAIPFGPRKSYTFTLNVKASVLQDLRLIRRRSFFDAAQF